MELVQGIKYLGMTFTGSMAFMKKYKEIKIEMPWRDFEKIKLYYTKLLLKGNNGLSSGILQEMKENRAQMNNNCHPPTEAVLVGRFFSWAELGGKLFN